MHRAPLLVPCTVNREPCTFDFIEGDIRNLETCHRAMFFPPRPSGGEGRGEGEMRPVDHVILQLKHFLITTKAQLASDQSIRSLLISGDFHVIRSLRLPRTYVR